MAILSPRINLPKRETGSSSQISAKVYIQRLPVILHDNLQQESHKHYGPPISVHITANITWADENWQLHR